MGGSDYGQSRRSPEICLTSFANGGKRITAGTTHLAAEATKAA